MALALEKKTFQFWWEIWIHVVDILLKLYECFINKKTYEKAFHPIEQSFLHFADFN